MQNSIEIAAAHHDDAATIVEIEHAYWRRNYVNSEAGISAEDIEAHLSHSPKEQQIVGWQVLIDSPDSIEFVAKSGAQIVGYVSLEKDPAGEINQIVVQPEFEASDAKEQLLQTALDFIGPGQPVQVYVVSFDEASKNFYLQHGFEPTDEIRKDFAFASGSQLPEQKFVRKPA